MVARHSARLFDHIAPSNPCVAGLTFLPAGWLPLGLQAATPITNDERIQIFDQAQRTAVAGPADVKLAGQAVLRLIDPVSVWVRVRLDQGRSAGLATGLPASIVLRSSAGQAATGKVVRVEMLSDSITEERTALVAFDRLPAGVSVGEMAEVTLQLPATRPALLLPNASIKRRGEQTGVWRVAAGELGFVPVRIGTSSLQGQVQVLDGLNPGDMVVAYSERDLAAGSRIKVVDSLVKAAP
mgnify:CR=1 FL=1